MKIYTEEQLMKEVIICDAEEVKIKNNIISKIDIFIVGHFGNAVSLELKGKHGEDIIPTYRVERIIGYAIRDFIDFFHLSREDGVRLSDLKDIPVRLVYDGFRLIAIGDFMEDRFFLVRDLFASRDSEEN